MTGLLLALALDAAQLQKAVEVFTPVLEVFFAASERSRAYDDFQREMGVEESRMAISDALETLDILGNRFYFDADGELWFDDRFVRPDERGAVDAAGRFFRERFAEELKARAASEPPPLPVFRGSEDARCQGHDGLIVRVVAEFNARRGEWAGATEEQARGIPELPPELVKARMIEDAGGPDLRSDAEIEQGLRESIRRLVRMGFGSPDDASARPERSFEGWYAALERCAGRGGYADRIVRRASAPKSFTPVDMSAGGRLGR